MPAQHSTPPEGMRARRKAGLCLCEEGGPPFGRAVAAQLADGAGERCVAKDNEHQRPFRGRAGETREHRDLLRRLL